VRIWSQPVPGDEEVEHRHGEGEVGLEIGPGAMARPLEVAHARQQRQDGLDEDALRPGAAPADLHVGRIPRRAVEIAVGEHERLPGAAGDQRVDGLDSYLWTGEV